MAFPSLLRPILISFSLLLVYIVVVVVLVVVREKEKKERSHCASAATLLESDNVGKEASNKGKERTGRCHLEVGAAPKNAPKKSFIPPLFRLANRQ